jgi:hypothetical protein
LTKKSSSIFIITCGKFGGIEMKRFLRKCSEKDMGLQLTIFSHNTLLWFMLMVVPMIP